MHLQDSDKIISMVTGMEGETMTVVATIKHDRETILPMQTGASRGCTKLDLLQPETATASAVVSQATWLETVRRTVRLDLTTQARLQD